MRMNNTTKLVFALEHIHHLHDLFEDNDFEKYLQDAVYTLDSQAQLDCCLEDHEYVKWLDPDPEVAAYPRKSDTVRSPYATT